MENDLAKARAAAKSLEFVENGMTLGLGTGSTVAHFLRLLGERVCDGLSIRGIPTSEQTRRQAMAEGIPLVGFEETEELDLCVDGADEIDSSFRLIKGGGGALLREKIVASASRRVVIIADAGKWVEKLGTFPLPVEVVPFAWPLLAHRIGGLGANTVLRVREDGEPFVTDSGNLILDCHFGRIEQPEQLARQLGALPGIVEHGLFIGLAHTVILGRPDGVEVLGRP
jgi:ribose 5-phosphate isomerase A